MSDITTATMEAHGYSQASNLTILGVGHSSFTLEDIVARFNIEAMGEAPDERKTALLVARMGMYLLKHGNFGPEPIDIGGETLLPYQPPMRAGSESDLYRPGNTQLGVLIKRLKGLGGDLEYFAMSGLWRVLREHDQTNEPLTIIPPRQYASLVQTTGALAGIGTTVMEELHGEMLGVLIEMAQSKSNDNEKAEDEARALRLIVTTALGVLQHVLPPDMFKLINDLTPDDSGFNLMTRGTYADIFNPAVRIVLALLDQPNLSREVRNRGLLMRTILQRDSP